MVVIIVLRLLVRSSLIITNIDDVDRIIHYYLVFGSNTRIPTTCFNYLRNLVLLAGSWFDKGHIKIYILCDSTFSCIHFAYSFLWRCFKNLQCFHFLKKYSSSYKFGSSGPSCMVFKLFTVSSQTAFAALSHGLWNTLATQKLLPFFKPAVDFHTLLWLIRFPPSMKTFPASKSGKLSYIDPSQKSVSL